MTESGVRVTFDFLCTSCSTIDTGIFLLPFGFVRLVRYLSDPVPETTVLVTNVRYQGTDDICLFSPITHADPNSNDNDFVCGELHRTRVSQSNLMKFKYGRKNNYYNYSNTQSRV